MRQHASQIERYLTAPVLAHALGIVAGTTRTDATGTVALALAQAGDQGESMEVKQHDGQTGILVLPPFNRVVLVNTATRKRLTDDGGMEIYGRLTYEAATHQFWLNYFSVDNTGQENQYDFPVACVVDFVFAYGFALEHFPFSSVAYIEQVLVNQGPNAVEVVGKNVVDSPSIIWTYDPVANKLSAAIKPDFFRALLLFQQITFRVGDAGFPVAGTSVFILKDCKGDTVRNAKLDFIREKEPQFPVDDFTYNPLTASMTVAPEFEPLERCIITASPLILWALCVSGGGGGGTTTFTGFPLRLPFILGNPTGGSGVTTNNRFTYTLPLIL